MQLQTSPNRWSCLPTAFAIALGDPVESVIAALGHDGSQVVRPGQPEPNCYLGFHIQELIEYAWRRGFAVTPIEARPRSYVDDGHVAQINFPEGNVSRIFTHLLNGGGVLTGQSLPSGNHHAVAWNGTCLLNPVGKIQNLDEFAINTFWHITPR